MLAQASVVTSTLVPADNHSATTNARRYGMSGNTVSEHPAAIDALVEWREQILVEWREQIGGRVMLAMRCAHEGDDFGSRSVCVTCFDSTQRIGALIERCAAEAWDQGRLAERRDWEFTADLATPDEERQPLPNPYRALPSDYVDEKAAHMPILTGYASRRAARVRRELQRRADAALAVSRGAAVDKRRSAVLRGKARGLREAVELVRALEAEGRIGSRRRERRTSLVNTLLWTIVGKERKP